MLHKERERENGKLRVKILFGDKLKKYLIQ